MSASPAAAAAATKPMMATRAALDTFARLQLAAALLEYEHDIDGKTAENSAIFAPFRDDAPVLDSYHGDEYPEGYAGEEEAGMAWRTNDRTSKRLSMAAGGAAPTVFTDYLRDSPNTGPPQGEPIPEDPAEPGVDDADLASEWGLESVMTKFDNLDANDLKSDTGAKKVKRRKNSRAQTDILGMMSDVEALNGQPVAADATEHFATQSLPDVLDHTLIRPRRKGPKESAGARARRASLESQLEMAFSGSQLPDVLDQGEEAAGGRSRSSSLGGMAPSMLSFNALAGPLDADDMAQLQADYAAETAARPASSMSQYVSRFDPKAIAAQKEEELSTRLRFPNSLHPKILVMPAPLADWNAASEEEQAEPEVEQPKPRIEREAGKLYGRSLMDELNDRKLRQKSKNRAFQGDSRRAMTDNLAMRHVRAPSPLGGAPADEEGATGPKKPLQPAKSLDDPWVKYTSHRSLAALASSPAEPHQPTSPSKRVTTLLSPGQSPHNSSPTTPRGHGISPSAQLSTAELQAAYKRASAMPLQANQQESDSDEDVPLQTRQAQLATSAGPSGSPVRAKPDPVKPMPSVFGQDLVMQAELAKLEKILKIEEAEKKIQAEKERILELERQVKDKKKREKAERKAKKKAEKERKTGKAPLPGQSDEATQAASLEPGIRQSRAPTLDEQTRTVLINHCLLPGEAGDYRQSAYLGQHAEGEEIWNGPENRASILPMPEGEDYEPMSGGRARTSSFAPSLALSFVPTLNDAVSIGGETLGGAKNWFAGSSSDSEGSEDDDAAEERLRTKSRLDHDRDAEDGHERVDPSKIWNASTGKAKASDSVERKGSFFDTAKKPELMQVSHGDGLSGLLAEFGTTGDESDEEQRGASRRKRVSTYDVKEDGSSDEEGRPLSTILLNRRSQAFHTSLNGKKPSGKITLDPPRLDLPSDLSLASPDRKGKGKASSDDSEESDAEDTSRAAKRLTASLSRSALPLDSNQDDEIDEDDLPLALRQEDELPLGQMHPQAAMSQQMSQQIEAQQQQNMMLVQQMQLQYQMTQQYQYEMHMQQMLAMQQAGIQYNPSLMNGYAGSQIMPVDMGGAPSVIGVGVPPDDRLVSSVDRWRQRVGQ